MNPKIKTHYLAFLVRLWREGEMKSWRATLENPHDGRRYGFSDLEKLYAFLDESTKDIDKEEIRNED
jgi:hypothetical protein